MSRSIPIVRKLQSDAIDTDMSVSSLLRTAKVLATKLELEDALLWIDRELDGYLELPVEDLPQYRRLTGDLRAWNPYHGWQPIHFEDSKTARLLSAAPIGSPIGAIEEDLKSGRRGYFGFNISPENKTIILKAIEFPTDVQLKLGYGALFGIIDAVRNLVLNWSLELEKAGILGEDMEFSKK